MKSPYIRIALAAVMVVLGDYLLFGHYPGCAVTIFALVLGAAVLATYRRDWRRFAPWAILWVILALGASLQSSIIGYLLLVALGWAIVALAVTVEGKALFAAILRGISGGVRACFAPVLEAVSYERLVKTTKPSSYVPVWVILVPALTIVVFAALVIPANLVLAHWGSQAIERLQQWLRNVTAVRFIFWVAVGCQVFGLTMFRPLGGMPKWFARRPGPPPPPNDRRPANETRAAVATLVGLNVVLLAANVVDIIYLWLAFALPPNVTYSQFAHQGADRLMLAVVLSAVTITGYFRVKSGPSTSKRARILAYVFSAQSLVILAGAARRLSFYVAAYGLTRLRVAAFIWMLVVLVGFVLIVVKLAKNLPFYWLVRINTVSVVLILAATSLAGVNGFIADWNVSMYERGVRNSVDTIYLSRRLGQAAMPALARLAHNAKTRAEATQAENALTWLISNTRNQRTHWQSWTLYSRRAVKEVAEKWDIAVPDASPKNDPQE